MNDLKRIPVSEWSMDLAWRMLCRVEGYDPDRNGHFKRCFEAGWRAAMNKAQNIVTGGEEWKLYKRDDA
jgi:hypothetical protein